MRASSKFLKSLTPGEKQALILVRSFGKRYAPSKPPLFLNKAWSGEKRSFKSQGKIIRDWLYYIPYYILYSTARNAKMNAEKFLTQKK